MNDRYKPLRIAIGALAAFTVVFVTAGAFGWGTPAANESPIGDISRWCERVSGGLLREPVNTLGNLGFVVAGLAMFWTLAREDSSTAANRFVGNQPLALLYASATVFLGPGSMVMHGSNTFFGAWIDNVSMVTYILIPWLVNVSVLGRWTQRTLFTVYGTLLGAYALTYWVFGSDLGIGLDLFGVSIGLWIISEVVYRWWSPAMRVASGFVGFAVASVFGITPMEMLDAPGEHWWVLLFWLPGLLATGPPIRKRRYTPWFWVGVASFLTAYAIWLTGTDDHEWCRPDSLLQAHAIWHLLSALATWGFFKFLRTERSTATIGQELTRN
ncbi:MAG: hypothetical protein HKN93_04730 [Acidimicrobiia bacterium]|nr:hypothetical protein [Acidimicrobiia bacterium]